MQIQLTVNIPEYDLSTLMLKIQALVLIEISDNIQKFDYPSIVEGRKSYFGKPDDIYLTINTNIKKQ